MSPVTVRRHAESRNAPIAIEALEPRSLLSVVSFADTFSPQPSALWSNTRGNWAATAGTYFAKNPSNNPIAFSGLPYVLSDLTTSVQVNSVGDSGIFLHANSTGNNGILLVIGGSGYGNGARGGGAGNSLYWHVITNAAAVVTSPIQTNVFTPGSTHVIKVTVKGNLYSAFIDNASTAVSTFTSSVYPQGEVGFYDDQPNKPAGGSGTPTTFSKFSLSGTAAPVKISGKVFNDSNGSGKIDTGEGGLPNVQVFLDTNKNGKIDAGEPLTKTAADGTYSFANLTPGVYHVTEVVPAGLLTTLPLSGERDVNAFGNVANVLFGNAAPVTVTGTVFSDANGDGLITSGVDKGLAGFKVFVDYNKNGILDAGEPSAISNSSGLFTITGARPGSFNLDELLQSTYTPTTPKVYNITAYGGTNLGGYLFGEKKI